MSGNLHFSPNLPDDALGIDEEGRSLHAHVLAAVERFLAPHAVGARGFDVGIGAEADLELVFCTKLLV